MDGPPGDVNGATDKGLIATAFYAYSTDLLIRAGEVIGEDMTFYRGLLQRIRAAYQERYMQQAQVLCPTQTAHVLTLHFGLCEPEQRPQVAAALADLIIQNGRRLTTGFVGTPYLLHALSDHGYRELAYDLLLQDAFPSWLYTVDHGATTMWEHWDGIKPDGSMWSEGMNSFNHYAYGAVGDWLFGVVAGICPCEDGPGYRKIHLEPLCDRRLRWAAASLETDYGILRSSWEITGEEVTYHFTVPQGCEAELVLHGERRMIGPGKHEFRYVLEQSGIE